MICRWGGGEGGGGRVDESRSRPGMHEYAGSCTVILIHAVLPPASSPSLPRDTCLYRAEQRPSHQQIFTCCRMYIQYSHMLPVTPWTD